MQSTQVITTEASIDQALIEKFGSDKEEFRDGIKAVYLTCFPHRKSYGEIYAAPSPAGFLLSKKIYQLEQAELSSQEFVTQVLSVLIVPAKKCLLNFRTAAVILKEAQAHYPGIEGQPVDTESAYKLYMEIPAKRKNAYPEAQFWIAKLICFHSSLTPENFETETDTDKLTRLEAMKPHLEAAAQGGHDLAQFELESLNLQLEVLNAYRSASRMVM